MIELIFQSIYFMLPAYFANMAPVFVKKINLLNYPIDNNKKLFGRPFLGVNKTWRGFFAAIIFGLIIFAIQKAIGVPSIIDYSTYSIFLGALFGFGAIGGDIIKSFFKRRFGVSSGKSWPVFDQLDFVVGSLICMSFFIPLSWSTIIIILIASPILTIAVNNAAYMLKIRRERW